MQCGLINLALGNFIKLFAALISPPLTFSCALLRLGEPLLKETERCVLMVMRPEFIFMYEVTLVALIQGICTGLSVGASFMVWLLVGQASYGRWRWRR